MVRTSPVVVLLALSGSAHAATFYVDASAGDDGRTLLQAQAEATPWRTLGRALTAPEIAEGDTVRIAPGAYGAGEPFPLPVRDGIAIVGAGPTATVITVPAGGRAAFRGTTSLGTSTLLGDFGLVYGGTTDEAADAIVFEGSSLTLSPAIHAVSIDGPFQRGVAVDLAHGALGARIADTTITGARQGVDVQTRAADVTLHIDDVTIAAVDRGVGIVATDGDFTFAPVLSGSTVFAEGAGAVYVAASSASSVTFAPRIVGNELHADGAPGATALHGQMQWIPTLTDRSVVGGNVITASGTGLFWWSLHFHTAPGQADIQTRIVGNDVSGGAIGITTGMNRLRGFQGTFDQQVTGNRVTDTALGMYAFGGLYESDLVGASLVAGNSIASSGTGTDYGVVQSLSASSNDNPQDLQFRDNVVTSDADAAAVLYDYAVGPAGIVSGNTIIGNPGAGLVLWANSVDPGYQAADLGGGERSSPGHNTLLGNGGADGPLGDFDLVNQTGHAVSARRTAWGATHDALIDGRISDDDESTEQGGVDFAEALCWQSSPAPRVTAAIAVVEDRGPAGLSGGDTVRIEATLAATGDIGCAAATASFASELGCADYVARSAASPTGFARAAEGASPPTVALGWIPAGTSGTATWDAVVADDPACTVVTALVRARCEPNVDVVALGSLAPAVDDTDPPDDPADDPVDDPADDVADDAEPADATTPQFTGRACPTCRPLARGVCGCATGGPQGTIAAWLGIAAFVGASRRGRESRS